MTGLYPSATGVTDNTTSLNRIDPSLTLPGVLKASGAQVAMFGKTFHADTITAAEQAKMFDEFSTGSAQGNPSRVINDGLKHDDARADAILVSTEGRASTG